MHKDFHTEIIRSEAENLASSVIPNDIGTISRIRLLDCLGTLGTKAFNEGRIYALTNLITTDQIAEIIGVSPRRMRAIAKNRHDRFGTGWQVPGTNTWLFTPEEIDILRPK